jgi:membrane protease YdiL (CAAX protease family)
VAEEVLFRGYLFGHLRRGRSFWRAAVLSMLPFVCVHLLLFFTMP